MDVTLINALEYEINYNWSAIYESWQGHLLSLRGDFSRRWCWVGGEGCVDSSGGDVFCVKSTLSLVNSHHTTQPRIMWHSHQPEKALSDCGQGGWGARGGAPDNNIAQPRRMLNNNRVSAGERDGYHGLLIMAVLLYSSGFHIAEGWHGDARAHTHTHVYNSFKLLVMSNRILPIPHGGYIFYFKLPLKTLVVTVTGCTSLPQYGGTPPRQMKHWDKLGRWAEKTTWFYGTAFQRTRTNLVQLWNFP